MVKEEFGLEELVGLRRSVAPACQRQQAVLQQIHGTTKLLYVYIARVTILKHSQTLW
jgi:hypothetical protein